MITLYDAVSLSKKKSMGIICLMILLWFLVYYLIQTDSTHSLLLVMKIAGIMLNFILFWIVLDMTHPFEMMIQSFVGQAYLKLTKHIAMMIWSIVLTISTVLVLILALIIKNQMTEIFLYFELGIHLFLDLIITGIIVIKLSKIKYPTISLAVPLFYTIYQLFIENKPSLFLYCVIPFFQPLIMHYSLVIPYKLCYISLGLLMTNYPKRKR